MGICRYSNRPIPLVKHVFFSAGWAEELSMELIADRRAPHLSLIHIYTYIPKDYTVPADAYYFHITTNNTIYGTELKEDLDVNVPMVADMSSDIFSRPIDVSK